MSGIDEILPWALDNFPPKDYDTYQDWFDAVSENFEDNGRLPLGSILNSIEELTMENAYYELTSKSTQQEIQDYIDIQQDEPITEEKRDTILDITRQPTTKREQTIETLRTVKRPISISEFVDLTGFVRSTARRELGVGVLRGDFKRVSKGVYEI